MCCLNGCIYRVLALLLICFHLGNISSLLGFACHTSEQGVHIALLVTQDCCSPFYQNVEHRLFYEKKLYKLMTWYHFVAVQLYTYLQCWEYASGNSRNRTCDEFDRHYYRLQVYFQWLFCMHNAYQYIVRGIKQEANMQMLSIHYAFTKIRILLMQRFGQHQETKNVSSMDYTQLNSHVFNFRQVATHSLRCIELFVKEEEDHG